MEAGFAFPILKEMGLRHPFDFAQGRLLSLAVRAAGWEYEDRVGIPPFAKTGRKDGATCKGGYRSSIATSILRRANFRDIANLTGGYDAWKAMN